MKKLGEPHDITMEHVGRKVSYDHTDALHSDWRFVNVTDRTAGST